ncbi:hypothetical protein [Streptococcus uberis]|uniref:hypothetical protein n=1 Tax=Streptococcus uberis TaxID=1349 RepID=UPI000DFDAE1C|nr:hypothetical protein [Streptococcus uberis]SUO89124.1 membrane protein [Streptococcus uberis]
MFQTIATIVFLIVVIFGILKIVSSIRDKSKPENATFARGNYHIQLKNLEEPINLFDNEKLTQHIKEILPSDDTNFYTVEADLNESALKELIMTEFGLSKEQVVVSRG